MKLNFVLGLRRLAWVAAVPLSLFSLASLGMPTEISGYTLTCAESFGSIPSDLIATREPPEPDGFIPDTPNIIYRPQRLSEQEAITLFKSKSAFPPKFIQANGEALWVLNETRKDNYRKLAFLGLCFYGVTVLFLQIGISVFAWIGRGFIGRSPN